MSATLNRVHILVHFEQKQWSLHKAKKKKIQFNLDKAKTAFLFSLNKAKNTLQFN